LISFKFIGSLRFLDTVGSLGFLGFVDILGTLGFLVTKYFECLRMADNLDRMLGNA
jgi:hypothetical protein